MKNPIRAAAVVTLLLTATATAVAQLGLVVTAGTRTPASSSLIIASATEAIRVCAYEARNQMLFDLETRLKSANEAVGDLSTEARSLTKDRQERFETAIQEIKSQERALRLGMQAAEKATQKSWPLTRAALAFSYSDYISVVTQAERIVADEEVLTGRSAGG